MSDEFSHLIEMNYSENTVTIYRVFSDGKKQLFTYTSFPSIKFDEDKDAFTSFAQILGENILLDSPISRKIFGI